MEKKYPPPLYAYKTIAGDWWATEKRQFGEHNIKADFEKLLPLITIEEHDAIVQNLVEALSQIAGMRFVAHNRPLDAQMIAVAMKALEKFKERTG